MTKAVPNRDDTRKNTGRQSGRKKNDTEKIQFEGERDKEREVAVRHVALLPKEATSVWSWHEEFVTEWSESLISKKGRKSGKLTTETRDKRFLTLQK